MNIQPDFEELLRLLEENEADYMIVGGYAVAFHGYPRFTKDLDIFFLNSPENIERVREALFRFGFSSDDLPVALFSTPGNVLTFGATPVRVDMMNEIDGVSYHDASRNILRGNYGTVSVPFIGREDLIANKMATPRAKDKGDAEELLNR